MNLWLLVFALSTIASSTINSFAFASTPGASSTALAGSGRSAVDSSESYLVNPASLAHFDGASLTLSTYLYRIPAKTYDTKAWRVSMAENSPMNDVPLAMSYGKSSDLNSQQSDFWLSAGNFISPYVSIGLTYHYSDRRTQTDKLSASTATSGLTQETPLNTLFENNASFGILVTPNPELGFSFVAQDFIKQTDKKNIEQNISKDSSSSNALINAPQLGIGAVYLSSSFLRLHADLMTDESPAYKYFNQVSLGLENMVNEWVLTRWGIAHANLAFSDSTEAFAQNSFAFGIGFIGPRFEIYLASKQNTGFQNSWEHSVDFHIPF